MKLKFIAPLFFVFLVACAPKAITRDYSLDIAFIRVARAEMVKAAADEGAVNQATRTQLADALAKAKANNKASLVALYGTDITPDQRDLKQALIQCFADKSLMWKSLDTGSQFVFDEAEARATVSCSKANDALNLDMKRVGLTAE